MTSTILYDGRHLAAATGTGLATYARQLALAARLGGRRTEAAFGVQKAVGGNSPLLAEISLFDAQPDTPPRFRARVLRFLRTWPGAPFGLKATKSTLRGDVVGADILQGIDHAHIVVRLFERAHAHFLRTGRFARLRISGDVAAFHATFPIPVRLSGRPNIVTIHDLIPLRMPFTSLDDKRYVYAMNKHAAESADHIVTVSEHTKRDIVELLGIPEDKITNTYQSIGIRDDVADNPDADIVRALASGFGLEPGGYYLFYGALEPKKNVGRLVEAYASSGSKRPLVIAGGLGWQYHDDLRRIEDERFVSLRRQADGGFSIHRRVLRLPFLPPEQLTSLIQGARAVLFPSLYEGFGLPVVEAMRLGTPVLTSNISSLPEVAGDAAVLVDPHDLGHMSRAIANLDSDDALVRDLSARGRRRAKFFGRDAYVERVKAMYDKVLGAS